MAGSRNNVNNERTRNVILPLKALNSFMLDNLMCRQCARVDTMEICAVTVGIATELKMSCTNRECLKFSESYVMEPSKVDLDKLVNNN